MRIGGRREQLEGKHSPETRLHTLVLPWRSVLKQLANLRCLCRWSALASFINANLPPQSRAWSCKSKWRAQVSALLTTVQRATQSILSDARTNAERIVPSVPLRTHQAISLLRVRRRLGRVNTRSAMEGNQKSIALLSDKKCLRTSRLTMPSYITCLLL